MSKPTDLDEELHGLEQAIKGQKMVASMDKVDLTLKVSVALKKKLQEAYGRNLSRMFEEAMIARLKADGFIKPRLPEPGEALRVVPPVADTKTAAKKKVTGKFTNKKR